ncbi:siphovirus ReqiPepy6 Gp37-like family protein [Enterococcus faecalis]|uniref:siphovirus ReqiPepy6 Gp37-like family protein n=1 Tax=Enterococcus faecalis TaxID=1351 RepID=UPI001E296259|nr:siphovirus ReqiPepy6 Gp37-like family protein [Enterococcus faecalis]MCD5046576.1 siphovirus ReqiPepy6 Gp37-like family protein [Enterococcus faecalis]
MDFMPLPFVEVFRRKSGFDYESTAVLDIWKSMSVKENFKSANTFETVVLLKYMPKELMDEDTVLLINNCFYYIDSIICDDLSSGLITISGKSLFAKSGKRIVYRIYNQTKRPELICYDHLRNEVVSPSDAKRKINYLSVEQPPAITNSNISYQNSYGNVEEEIEGLCESYNFGFDEIPISNGRIGSTSNGQVGTNIRFRKSEDVSSVVQFSAEFENVTNESLEKNNYDEATTALIYGEGEGKARKHTQVNNNLSSLERKEIYVDARDLQQTVDDVKMPDAQYIATLQSRGKEKLTEQPRVLALNGTINLNDSLFVYGRDYKLGDRVKRISSFGYSDTVVLNSVTQTWDEKGYHIDGEFGNQSKTIIDVIKRKGK